MVAALLMLLALPQQGQTITFESPGITVQGFCEELSRQTGQKYAAWDSVRGDLVAFRLEGVPLDEVLKRLEFVERAKLDFDGKTYNLRPDEAVRAKFRAEYQADRVKKIKETQDRVRSLLRAGPLDPTEAKAISKKFSDLQKARHAQDEAGDNGGSLYTWLQSKDQELRLPTGQTMLRLFLAISPEELAAIPPGGSAVWSTAPTSVERPSPIDGRQLIDGYAADQQVWSDLSAQISKSGVGAFSRHEPPPGTQIPAALRFELHAGVGVTFVMDLAGFDASGKTLFENVQTSWTPESFAVSAKNAKEGEPGPDAHPHYISIPPATAKLIRLWSAYPTRQEISRWRTDKTLIEMYFNPEKYDPVAETFGRMMLELAKDEKKPLIAAESADCARLLPEKCIVKDQINIAMLERDLLATKEMAYHPIQFASDDGWITTRPGIPDNLVNEFDRAELGKLYRTARDNHRLTLMDVARFAAGHEGQFGVFGLITDVALPVFIPDLGGYQLLNDGNWPIKTFLGRLDDNQIAIAQQPDGLPLAGCTGPQLDALRVAYQMGRFSYHEQINVWRSYTTDALPNGLPGNGILHLSIDSGAALHAQIGEPGEYVESNQFYTPQQLAERLIMKAGHERMNSYNLLGVSTQSRQTYIFRFDFPDQVLKIDKLNDYSPTSKEVTSVDLLPEPLRTQVKDAMRKYEKS